MEQTRREFFRKAVGVALAVSGLEVLAGENQGYKTDDFSKDTERILLARMIWGEARSCHDIEKVAVAYTAVNRANDGKKWNGETIQEAILKPLQYSCFNKNDPNRNKLKDPEKYDAQSFQRCLRISEIVIGKEFEDPTKGATHYFNPDIAKPKWADKMRKIGKIPVGEKDGRTIYSKHEFYEEK